MTMKKVEGRRRKGPPPPRFEEDEEIDEDDAFSPEDYAKYGDIGGSGKTKEHEADQDGSMIQLSDLLDDEGSKHQSSPKSKAAEKTPTSESDEETESAEEERGSESESSSDSDESEEELDAEKHGALLRAIHQMDGGKRRKVRLRTESVPESEFAIPALVSTADEKPSGAETDDKEQRSGSYGKVTLNDLLTPLEEQPGFSSLERKMKNLKRDKATKKLLQPLAETKQEELSRTEHYEETKKEISRWSDLIKQNRLLPQLRFGDRKKTIETLSSFVSKFQATTDLEKDFESLLKEYGMDEKKLKETEELKMNEMTMEEALERKAHLQKFRSLMFFEEIKYKRMKKIKSKTYRKQLRKLKGKNKLSMDELADLDPELAEAEQLKIERRRIQERMSLKHKNTGKWAQRLKRRGEKVDKETRGAVEDQLRLGQKLRHKMNSMNSDSESNSDLEEQSSEEETESNSQKRLQQLDELQNEKPELPKTGLFALKFMQRGLEEQKKEQEDLMEEFDKEKIEEIIRVKKKSERPTSDTESDAIEEPRPKIGRKSLGGKRVRDVTPNSDEKKSTSQAAEILPGTLQSAKIGLAVGHKTQVDGFLTIRDGKSEQAKEIDNFETVEFSDTEDSTKLSSDILNKTEIEESKDDGDKVPKKGKKKRKRSRRRKKTATNKDTAPLTSTPLSSKSRKISEKQNLNLDTSSQSSWLKAPSERLDDEELIPEASKHALPQKISCSIEGTVYLLGKETLQDEIESKGAKRAVPGVSVTLYREDEEEPYESTKTVNGGYIFEKICPGNWKVVVRNPDEKKYDEVVAISSECPLQKNEEKSLMTVRVSLSNGLEMSVDFGLRRHTDTPVPTKTQPKRDVSQPKETPKKNDIQNIETPEAKETKAQPSLSKTNNTANSKSSKSDARKRKKKRNPWLSDPKTGGTSSSKPQSKKKRKRPETSSELDPSKQLLIDVDNPNTEGFSLLGSGSEEQKKLVQRAFANAGAEQEDFEKEKKEVSGQGELKEDDGIIPGWGSWIGTGVKTFPKKKKKKIERKDKKQNNPTRKDANLPHVIINEKRMKKAAHLQLSKLPYPYTSRAQYERTLQLTIGSEWNTVTTHRDNLKPSIVVQPGTIVAPIKYQETIKQKRKRSKAANKRMPKIERPTKLSRHTKTQKSVKVK